MYVTSRIAVRLLGACLNDLLHRFPISHASDEAFGLLLTNEYMQLELERIDGNDLYKITLPASSATKWRDYDRRYSHKNELHTYALPNHKLLNTKDRQFKDVAERIVLNARARLLSQTKALAVVEYFRDAPYLQTPFHKLRMIGNIAAKARASYANSDLFKRDNGTRIADGYFLNREPIMFYNPANIISLNEIVQNESDFSQPAIRALEHYLGPSAYTTQACFSSANAFLWLYQLCMDDGLDKIASIALRESQKRTIYTYGASDDKKGDCSGWLKYELTRAYGLKFPRVDSETAAARLRTDPTLAIDNEFLKGSGAEAAIWVLGPKDGSGDGHVGLILRLPSFSKRFILFDCARLSSSRGIVDGTVIRFLDKYNPTHPRWAGISNFKTHFKLEL